MKRVLPYRHWAVLSYSTLLLFSVAANAKQSNEITPSIDFLEYLAEMTEVDGQLIGPQDIAKVNCHSQSVKESENESKTDSGSKVEQKQNDKENVSKKSPDQKGCIDEN